MNSSNLFFFGKSQNITLHHIPYDPLSSKKIASPDQTDWMEEMAQEMEGDFSNKLHQIWKEGNIVNFPIFAARNFFMTRGDSDGLRPKKKLLSSQSHFMNLIIPRKLWNCQELSDLTAKIRHIRHLKKSLLAPQSRFPKLFFYSSRCSIRKESWAPF